jgi:hypothetical protein
MWLMNSENSSKQDKRSDLIKGKITDVSWWEIWAQTMDMSYNTVDFGWNLFQILREGNWKKRENKILENWVRGLQRNGRMNKKEVFLMVSYRPAKSLKNDPIDFAHVSIE